MGAQRPRAPHSAVQLLGLVLGTAAALHCVGNTYPKDGKCCSECPPGEWSGHRTGEGCMWGHGDEVHGERGHGDLGHGDMGTRGQGP